MKRKLPVLLFTILLFQFINISFAGAATIENQHISSQGACVMDYETGEILYHYKGNDPRVPASLTKIMSMYCIYEALEKEEITLDTVVPISTNVYNLSRNPVYQNVYPFSYDEVYTVDEMIDVVVTYSASAAAAALAELVGGGSEEAFVKRMNDTASAMGIDAYYYDSYGIADNMMSPVAMARLSRNIIAEYPDIIVRSSKSSVDFHGRNYKTTNHLLDTFYYQGADGLKTGTTTAAGYCLCGTAVRNGRRIIAVTMGSSSAQQRFVDVAQLLDYGFMVARDKFDTVYFTNLRTFINNCEVPTFIYHGVEPHTVIAADDLINYGFDLCWKNEERTLYMEYNDNKTYAPMSMEYYKSMNGCKAFELVNESNINVVLDNGIDRYIFEDVYVTQGYTLISVDELSNIFDFLWDSNEGAASIEIY